MLSQTENIPDSVDNTLIKKNENNTPLKSKMVNDENSEYNLTNAKSRLSVTTAKKHQSKSTNNLYEINEDPSSKNNYLINGISKYMKELDKIV